MKFFPFIFTLLVSQIVFCQTDSDDDKQKIATVFEDYFDLEREAIHIHVDKTTFLTNESIWYQGYIIDRKTKKPYFTSNVFVLLYDEKGHKISEKLIYANDGSFSGKFEMNAGFHSGIYYIQAYTNWMNNFQENESALQKITIINPKEGAKNYKKVNPHTLELAVNPEGGNLILGISNTIGVQIKDCRGNAPESCEAELKTNSGEILSTTKLNRFGYGKFEFTPLNNNYKVVVNYGGESITKQVPNADIAGFAIKVNNFSQAGKTLINLKTNQLTVHSLSAKKLYMVIHQDQKSCIVDVNLNETTLDQTITVSSSALSPGINTIRIIDSDLKEYASRLTYIYPKIEKSITLAKNVQKGSSVQLIGQSKYPNATLSTAFLPEQSVALDDNNNIFSGLTINPYLTENLQHGNYYFNNPNRMQFYELDLALLNQSKNKYNWESMKSSKPTVKYSFDMGLDLKGNIDPVIKNKPYHKIKLISYKNLLWLNSDIDEKGEYAFEHVLMPDSTYVEMSLHKLPDFSLIKSKLTPQVVNSKRPFLNGFKIDIPEHCDDNLEMFDLDFLGYTDKKAIVLKEVEVENKQNKLRYASQLGNSNLRGYKIDESYDTQTLLRFLSFNGFDVEETVGQASIHTRGRNSLNGAQAVPAIYIDGRQVMSIIEIEQMQMYEIEEIFLNPHAIVPSVKNLQGIIKIYRKKLRFEKEDKTKNGMYITGGFSKYENYFNANYDSIGFEGFNSLGLLNWTHRMMTDEKGAFSIELELTNSNNKKGKTVIQGMTNDGVLFQEDIITEL